MKTAKLQIGRTADEQTREDLLALDPFGWPADLEPYDGPESEWPPSSPEELAALDVYYDEQQRQWEEEWVRKNGTPPF